LLKKSTGAEWLRASIGQTFYFDDRLVSLNPNLLDPDELIRDESNYAAEIAMRLGSHFRASADLLYDDNDGKIDKGSLNLRYSDDDLIFNLGYRYTRRPVRNIGGLDTISTDIEQGDISAVIPLFTNWNVVGRWNYDFTNSRELETFAGIEYNSCCWRVSLLARRWIDRDDDLFFLPEEQLEEDQGIFFQIQFKGLAGTGSKLDSILTDGIYGYQAPQN